MKATKTVKFEMAHRLVGHPGLCKNLHGHSYVVDITLEGNNINSGMVLDFSIIKQIWEEQFGILDHCTMLQHCEENAELIELLNKMGMRVVVVPYNPTAENMAKAFKEKLQYRLDDYTNYNSMEHVTISSVRVHETTSSVAEA